MEDLLLVGSQFRLGSLWGTRRHEPTVLLRLWLTLCFTLSQVLIRHDTFNGSIIKKPVAFQVKRRQVMLHWQALKDSTFRATRTAWDLDLSPTVAEPCFTASMAYSIWWMRPCTEVNNSCLHFMPWRDSDAQTFTFLKDRLKQRTHLRAPYRHVVVVLIAKLKIGNNPLFDRNKGKSSQKKIWAYIVVLHHPQLPFCTIWHPSNHHRSLCVCWTRVLYFYHNWIIDKYSFVCSH